MGTRIYNYTRQKLITHGVENSKDGRLLLSDRTLFLLFVGLERARQSKDFETVQKAYDKIESYVTALGKRHLVIFALLYLRFSDASPGSTGLDEDLKDGAVNKTYEYRRPVTDDEVAISAWAVAKYNRYEKSFFRALHLNG